MAFAAFFGVIAVLLMYSIEAAPTENGIDCMIFDEGKVETPKKRNSHDTENLVGCECMAFHLCKNNTMDEYYGEGVIDIR